MNQIWHLRYVSLLILTLHLPPCNMRLQSFIEVQSTSDSVGDCEDDENDGDDGKGS